MNNKILPMLAALTLSANAMATTLYVKTDGSSVADCLTWDTACDSLSRAASQAVSDDEIHIAEGVYTPSATVTISAKNLTLIGGFRVGDADPEPNKYTTVISGDTANTDTNKVDGVTTDWSNIVGADNLSRWLLVTNSDLSLKNVTITAMKGLEADHHGSVVRFSVAANENHTLLLDNVKVIGNRSYSLAPLFINGTGQAHLQASYSLFEGNKGDAGGVISVHNGGSSAELEFSAFRSNEVEADTYGWNQGSGGAIFSLGKLVVKSSLFESNSSATGQGGAIHSEDGTQHIENSTFVNNTALGNGGAVNIAGGSGNQILYSTFTNNTSQASGGAINLSAGTGFLANIIMGNTATTAGANINNIGSNASDEGFNLIGYNSVTGINGGFITASSATTPAPVAAIDEVMEAALADNGGAIESLRLKADSAARNIIPNEAVTFWGQGTSASGPFTSLSQAHGAMKKFEGYTEGVYYFDLEATYTGSGSDIVYTAGSNANAKFSTLVDKNGYVLVASAEPDSPTPAAYAETHDLYRRSDQILHRNVLAHAGFDVSEVRISSYSNGDRGTFDGYSVDADVIYALKHFEPLPNAGSGGDWEVTHTSEGVNYLTGQAYTSALTLAEDIYNANGDVGIYWVPNSAIAQKEALTDPGDAVIPDHSDALELWVRSSKGNCDGSDVNTDSRGLPRSDFVNEADIHQSGKKQNCDAGSFEFNNGYRLDCYSEDGMRPGIVTGSANGESTVEADVCFGGDLLKATPESLINNLGAINYFYLWLLGAAFYIRRRR